ncbi:MAG: caspase family protein, partial [Coleofasciculus sp. C2-GNP5-27]
MSRDALVVGINKYERFNPLNAPGGDAEAIAQRLEQYGEFKVTRLPGVKDKQNNRIRVGQKTKVTLSQLRNAIVQLFKPKGKSVPDTALLYFSGHGLRQDLGVEEGFLASSDVNPEGENWGLPLQWLRRLLLASEVRQQIVILDCCYSGEVLNFAQADPGEGGKARDRCFIAASREFEVAYEGIDGSHSAFTAALLEALEPKSERWVTNYTVVERLNQIGSEFPQRWICSNSGEPINLTRSLTPLIPK